MRKILSIIIALVTFAGIADAQISIKKSDYDRVKQVATLSMYWSWIYQNSDGYYLVINSNNQFDDSFWLLIGKTKNECLESLSSLQELFDTMEETDCIYIDNGLGESFDVSMTKSLGFKQMIFHGEGYAGTGFLYVANINKAIKWIEKNVK